MALQIEETSLAGALERIRQHELGGNFRYCAYQSTKDFGSGGLQRVKGIHFEDGPLVKVGRIPFTGVPFSVLGTKCFDCQYGVDRKKKFKLKRRLEKGGEEHIYSKGNEKPSTCKKYECPARCHIREVARFPAWRVELDASPIEKKGVASNLLYNIREGADVIYEKVFIVCTPDPNDHAFHPVEDHQETIDPRIARKIVELGNQGITGLRNVRKELQLYVREICQPLPHPSNKRFYPTDRSISNHIYCAKRRRKNTSKDNVELMIDGIDDEIEDFTDMENETDAAVASVDQSYGNQDRSQPAPKPNPQSHSHTDQDAEERQRIVAQGLNNMFKEQTRLLAEILQETKRTNEILSQLFPVSLTE